MGRCCDETAATRLQNQFEYSSGENDDWLGVEQIRTAVAALEQEP